MIICFRNLTETHLGQVLTIYPTAFEFKQEKLRQGPGQAPKYELSIKPLLEKNSGKNCISNFIFLFLWCAEINSHYATDQ